MEFKEIKLTEIEANPFKMIGQGWMLITAGDEDGYNMMTASWGGLGVMWGKNVATVVVRPQRHTLSFLDNSEHFTLSFYGEEYRDALKYCGAHSGKDVNKTEQTGLEPVFIDGTTTFEQADTTLICKKLYRQELRADCFIDKGLLTNYPLQDYHVVFTGEIIKTITKK